MEDGRDLISRCRKEGGKKHGFIWKTTRVFPVSGGFLLETVVSCCRRESRVNQTPFLANPTSFKPHQEHVSSASLSSLFFNSVICPSSLLCRNWRLATRQERRRSNIRVPKSLFMGLMENESRSWEIGAAILRGWTAQTFHIDRDLRLWFPNKLIAMNAALIITYLSMSYKSRTIERNHCGDDWVCFRSGRMESESIWIWENRFRPYMKTRKGNMKWLEMWRW